MKKINWLMGLMTVACGASGMAADSSQPKLDFDCIDQMKSIAVLSSGYSSNALANPKDYGYPMNDVKISHLTVTNTFRDAAGFIEGTQTADVSDVSSLISGKIVVNATRGGCIVQSVSLKVK
jgi:hypothetical protein